MHPFRLALPAALALAAACRPAADEGARTPPRDTAAAPVAADTPAPAPAPVAEAPGGPAFSFRLHPGLPPYVFTLERDGAGAVTAIRARAAEGDGEEQALRVPEDVSHAILEPGSRLSVEDVDFDGYGDLAFLAESAQANSWSDYWRFDPGSRRFLPLGRFPTLERDTAARVLSSYQRGGHGGRLFTASRYGWSGGRLVEVRREAQEWDDAAGRYVHVVSELRDGRLVETGRTPLAEEEARPGPSWWPGEG